MLKRLSRLDRLIVLSEARILEQVLLIARMEAAEEDTTAARQTLASNESSLVEILLARRKTEALRERIQSAPRKVRPYRAKAAEEE